MADVENNGDRPVTKKVKHSPAKEKESIKEAEKETASQKRSIEEDEEIAGVPPTKKTKTSTVKATAKSGSDDTDSVKEKRHIEEVEEKTDIHPSKKAKTSPKKESGENDAQPQTTDEPSSLNKSEDKHENASKVKQIEPTKLERKIIQQIEYYFGDSNLSRDKFLQSEITKDDGWVPFSVLLTFKRLASLSSDVKTIVIALEKSDEGLIEINEDRDKIRRHIDRPLPEQNEETRKECISRTAYVKGFPVDTEIADLIEFFNPFEKIANIVMRKYLDKPTKLYKFKGSAFVTFVTKAQCVEFLEKENLKYKENDLEKKLQSEYYESKKEERQNDKKKNRRGEENSSINLPKGAVIYLDGLGKDTTRESIKTVFSDLGADIAFIDYNKGDSSGHVRLNLEDSAKNIVDKLEDSKVKIDVNEATALVLEGDEEKIFLKKVIENMKSKRVHGNRFKGGQNNRYQNRKRRGSDTA